MQRPPPSPCTSRRARRGRLLWHAAVALDPGPAKFHVHHQLRAVELQLSAGGRSRRTCHTVVGRLERHLAGSHAQLRRQLRRHRLLHLLRVCLNVVQHLHSTQSMGRGNEIEKRGAERRQRRPGWAAWQGSTCKEWRQPLPACMHSHCRRSCCRPHPQPEAGKVAGGPARVGTERAPRPVGTVASQNCRHPAARA